MRPADPRSASFPPPGAPPRAAQPGEVLVRRVRGRAYTTAAMTFAAVTLILPGAVLFSVGCSVVAISRDDPWAKRALVGSIACLAGGIALAVIAADLDANSFASLLSRTPRP